MKSLNEDQMFRIFAKSGYSTGDSITKEQLKKFLEDQTKGKHDQDVLDQIVDNCPKGDEDNKYQIEQIVQTYKRAETILNKKLTILDDQISQYSEQLNVCKQREEENKYTQSKNIFGISDDSVCEVKISELKGVEIQAARDSAISWQHQDLGQPRLSAGQLKQDFAVFSSVTLKNQQYLTRQANFFKNEGLYRWDDPESFTFQLDHGKETILIEIGLIDQSSPGNNLLIGKTNLAVENFLDQVPREDWFKVLDERNKPIPGEIKVYIHVVHDRTKYYEETSKKISDYINSLEVQRGDLLHDLQTIQQPFSQLPTNTQNNPNKIKINRITTRKSVTDQNNIQQKQVYSHQPENTQQTQIDEESQEEFCTMLGKPKDQLEMQEFFQLMIGVVVAMVVFIGFTCYYRAAFLDIVYLAAFLTSVLQNQILTGKVKMLQLALLGTILYDMLWLYFFQHKLWVLQEMSQDLTSVQAMADFANETSLMAKMSVIFSYFNLTMKFVLQFQLIVLYKISKNCRQMYKIVVFGRNLNVGPYIPIEPRPRIN